MTTTNFRIESMIEAEERAVAKDIEGYTLAIMRFRGEDKSPQVVDELDLRLCDLGGVHLKNPDDLITKIEDAIFIEERAKHADDQ